MTTRLIQNDTSSFKIRRSLITANGFASDVDPLVKTHLDEVNELLGKKIFPISTSRSGATKGGGAAAGAAEAPAIAETVEAGLKDVEAKASDAEHLHVQSEVKRLLRLVLSPKHIPKIEGSASSWAEGSLGDILFKTPERAPKLSISDYIDETAVLAQLKYSFLDAMRESWSTLTYNVRTVLEDYPFITDYLIAYAYHVKKVAEISALKNFITNNKFGTRRIADYAAVSAARSLIDKEQLKVEGYNSDTGPFVDELTEAPILLSATSFSKSVREKIEQFVFDRDEEEIIDQASIGELPAGIKPLLIKYIQQSPVPITKENAALFLPHFVLEITKFEGAQSPQVIDVEPSDSDFDVQFQDDTDTTIEISKPAVRCAAQLYHGMVLGDELDVFGAVAYLTHKRLLSNGGIKIESRVLRNDLQLYVFSNQFTDLKTGLRMERTRPAERQMFHQQVFDQGSMRVPEGLGMNGEFKQLWKVLILESAHYLERAQASMDPDSYVSRQNVMQAVEDLQYNLSTHCTGMSTVISPIADAELNFVLDRILNHPEIVQQIVPEGGTWKRVVEKLNAEQRKSPGSAATLYNKAKFGQGIIDAIADYTPAAFEDDGIFSAFISMVDAFITTQSILQRRPKLAALRDEYVEEEGPGDRGVPAMMPGEHDAEAEPANVAAGADEWDF